MKNPGLIISKNRLKKNFLIEYNELQDNFGEDRYIYEYRKQGASHSYYLGIKDKEIPFISIKSGLFELVRGIAFGQTLNK